jgi:hypothetical protein
VLLDQTLGFGQVGLGRSPGIRGLAEEEPGLAKVNVGTMESGMEPRWAISQA